MVRNCPIGRVSIRYSNRIWRALDYPLNRMRETQNTPRFRFRRWIALLVVGGFGHAPCALAQIYKCTDADGRSAYSDKPCVTLGAAGTATGTDGVKQEALRQPKQA